MNLFDYLNKANKGWRVPMFVYDCYVGSKHTTYIKKACFQLSSFPALESNLFERQPGLVKPSLVEIDHLEKTMHGIALFLNLDGQIKEHYEPSINLDYDSLQLNDKFQIIGGTIWDRREYPAKKQIYLF